MHTPVKHIEGIYMHVGNWDGTKMRLLIGVLCECPFGVEIDISWREEVINI